MKKYMSKSEKSSKNKKPDFTVVIFYGAFAVGKYTVAKEFQKETGFRFFHNHHTVDLVDELFPRATLPSARLNEKIRFEAFKEIARSKINVVVTHAYSAEFVSKTGISDPGYVKKVEKIINTGGGVCYFVHLVASDETLIKRVSGKSRRKFKKLKDPVIMKKVLKEIGRDFKTSAPVKNNLQIDNTNLSPKKVVQIVRKHFNL